MERNEKLEMLTALVGEFGFSCDDVVSYWKIIGKLEAEQSQPLIPAETEEAPQGQNSEKVTPGMFVYVDGLISSEIIEGRQIKAVIGYVEGSEALAIGFEVDGIPWSSGLLGVKASRRMTKGQEATREIMECSSKAEETAGAAWWCCSYNKDGVKRGEAFLPSLDELKKLSENRDAINASLEALNMPYFSSVYWSSNEKDTGTAMALDVSSGKSYVYAKYNPYRVRPIISVKL